MESPLREAVAEACRVLARLELTNGTNGHVSARMPGADHMLVRARGAGETGVALTKADQIIRVDFDGRRISPADDGLAVPLEIFIHAEIYRAREDVGSVVHLHPVAPVLCTMTETPLLPVFGAYDPLAALLAVRGIPAYARSILIDTPALGHELAAVLGDRSACTMHGHGITAIGGSVIEASLTAIQLNELAEMNYRVRQIGRQVAISEADQEVLSALMPDAGLSTTPTPRMLALWRYYQTCTHA